MNNHIHTCENMPDTVEIRYDSFYHNFVLISDCDVYSDSQKQSFFLVRNEILDIEFCPFCGERLKS